MTSNLRTPETGQVVPHVGSNAQYAARLLVRPAQHGVVPQAQPIEAAQPYVPRVGAFLAGKRRGRLQAPADRSQHERDAQRCDW